MPLFVRESRDIHHLAGEVEIGLLGEALFVFEEVVEEVREVITASDLDLREVSRRNGACVDEPGLQKPTIYPQLERCSRSGKLQDFGCCLAPAQTQRESARLLQDRDFDLIVLSN